jgi:8-oxo-dGTP pyrophosphatase MutT (NUDIX family)/phosphohistidine phosphatase SixA
VAQGGPERTAGGGRLTMAADPIRAAGVVLLREGPNGQEFLLVHRPGREDWSLPKGKIEPGEHLVTAAVRECDEESGYWPVLMAPLPSQSYTVGGRPKVVNYWRARVREDAGFAADDEVDQILWLPVADAPTQLTYPSEVGLVEIAASLEDTVPMVILRHSQAQKRAKFDGDDDAQRPLSGKGRSHAKGLVPLLEAYGITSVNSSSSRRCIDTVRRYAKHAETSVVEEPALSEESFDRDPAGTVRTAVGLALAAEPLVVCTHRPVLPEFIAAVAGALGVVPSEKKWRGAWDPHLPPSGFIVIHRHFGADGRATVVAVERHDLDNIKGG